MDFGVMMFPTDDAVAPDELARMAEDRGFESLFFPEHTHIPASRESDYPGGGELPAMYSHTHDPFVALAIAAGATKRLLVGTGICLVIERDPITTAKEVASLDQLSGGRFLFGVGAGWNREEMANHGTDPGRRFGVMRERVEAMKAIWTEDEASYHGRHVDFDPIWSWPKPVQKPHPPILLGGAYPWAARRAVRYGDGWYPNASSGDPAEYMPAFRRMAEEAGRDPQSLPVTIGGAPEDVAGLQRLRDLGAVRVNVTLPAEGADQIIPILDRWAALIRQLGS